MDNNKISNTSTENLNHPVSSTIETTKNRTTNYNAKNEPMINPKVAATINRSGHKTFCSSNMSCFCRRCCECLYIWLPVISFQTGY